MSAHDVRWAVVGAGGLARGVAPEIVATAGSALVAVGSRDPERAAAVVRAAGLDPGDVAIGSRDEVLARDDVDVVWVTTIHPLHDQDARAALAAGKAVLCEKPLTTSLPATESLLATARTSGRLLAEAVWTRFNPLVQRVVGLVRDGAIGTVRHVHADFSIDRPYRPGHRLYEPALGGSALLDLGIYPVAWAHLLLGEPETVQVGGELAPTGVDRSAALLLRWADGELATLTCSADGLGRNRVTVVGSTGRIEVDEPHWAPDSAWLVRPDGSAEHLTHPHGTFRYVFQVAEVAESVRAGLLETPSSPHAETLAVARTLQRALDGLGVRTGTEALR